MVRGGKEERQSCLFGWIAVVLGEGDSFHLVPGGAALSVVRAALRQKP